MASVAARLRATALSNPFAAIWIATVLLFGLSFILAPGSVSGSALLGMLPFAAILAIASIGQTLVVQQRGLDLSVPGVITLSTIIVTRVPAGDDARLPLGIALALGGTALAGLVSGLAVTRFGITPVVATLAVNALLIGAIYQVTGGAQSALASPALNDVGIGLTLGIPNTVMFAVLAVTVVSIVIRGTVVGRWFVAVGANPAAAEVAGIPVTHYRVATFVAASVCGALAGILLAGFLGSPGLNAGDGYLLPTIAAVVLGGTSLAGGSGSVVATAGGALFLTQLQLLVLSMGAPQPFQLIVQGAIIAVGMAMRNVPWQRLRGRVWPAPAAPPAVLP